MGPLTAAIVRLGSRSKVAAGLCQPWASCLWQRIMTAAEPGLDWGPGALFTLSFDIDYEADVRALPELQRRLDGHGIAASFAAIGAWVRRFPAPHAALAASGHELLNHTQNHPDNEELCPDRHFHRLSSAERKQEIIDCDETLRTELGLRAQGFRTPHFGYQHTGDVYAVCAQLGYGYSTSTTIAQHTPPVFAGRRGSIWELPVTTCPRHPFAVLDTWHAVRKKRPRHSAPGELLQLFTYALDHVCANGTWLNLYFDPRDAVSGEVEAMLAAAAGRRDAGQLRIATYAEIIAAAETSPVTDDDVAADGGRP